jgi:hypothetical protein
MHESTGPLAVNHGLHFPSPPRLHWAVLLVGFICAEVATCWLIRTPFRAFAVFAVAAAWPTYQCVWVRKIDQNASSLYWAIASLALGVGFLFSWLLLIVVIFELREELLEHYNRREPMKLRLDFLLTILFSFVYFQYKLNKISKKKRAMESESLSHEPESAMEHHHSAQPHGSFSA